MNCNFFHSTTPHPQGFLEIDPASLASQPRARVIDVREPGELKGELGRIVGAENVPLATVASAADAWPRDEPIVVVCRSGGRSGKAVQLLRTLGFQCVVNLRGGMLSYRQNN